MDLALCKQEVSRRCKLTEAVFNKFLKTSELDEHLLRELQNVGVKLAGKKLKLADKTLAPIETNLQKIEKQARLGIACAVTQSWLIEHASQQLIKMRDTLKQCLSESDYNQLLSKSDPDMILESMVMAQDAALDTLGLQARETAITVGLRRSMWLDQTSWAHFQG